MSDTALDEFFSMMTPGRSLYLGDNGQWHFTYHRGAIDEAVVARALATGRLCREYSGQPGCYVVGDKTIDRARFFAIPPKQRRRMEPIYLDQPERDLTLGAARARPRS